MQAQTVFISFLTDLTYGIPVLDFPNYHKLPFEVVKTFLQQSVIYYRVFNWLVHPKRTFLSVITFPDVVPNSLDLHSSSEHK